MKKKEILTSIFNLHEMYKKGLLGGEKLPEDANPGLPKGSADNYHYFTLPMSLNYQRNSYALWTSAKSTFNDSSTSMIFRPQMAANMPDKELSTKLTLHKLAIQPVKQVKIWKVISQTIFERFDGDIRKLFRVCEWHVPYIMEYVQKENKKLFPYLSGLKLCSYWLHVLERYTDASFTGRVFLSIAPDTHVIKASVKLGIISSNAALRSDAQQIVSDAWKDLLQGTELNPIDMHTPLWFWSRGGFRDIVDCK